MRRVGFGLVYVVLCAAAVLAQRTVTYEKLHVTDGPDGLASATLDPPGEAQITRCQGRLETAQIRLLDLRAGTVSATTGRVLEVGDVVDLDTHDSASNVRFAKTGSTTGVLNVECIQ